MVARLLGQFVDGAVMWICARVTFGPADIHAASGSLNLLDKILHNLAFSTGVPAFVRQCWVGQANFAIVYVRSHVLRISK